MEKREVERIDGEDRLTVNGERVQYALKVRIQLTHAWFSHGAQRRVRHSSAAHKSCLKPGNQVARERARLDMLLEGGEGSRDNTAARKWGVKDPGRHNLSLQRLQVHVSVVTNYSKASRRGPPLGKWQSQETNQGHGPRAITGKASEGEEPNLLFCGAEYTGGILPIQQRGERRRRAGW